MARILCIDFGKKRTGIAVTDELQIIATALTTVDTQVLYKFLIEYCAKEKVEKFLIGYPLNLDDSPTHATKLVEQAIKSIQKRFPNTPIETIDESFTSKLASIAMIEMGMKKKDRQHKPNTDKIAATIMLQEYLQRNN
ncbi:MAG: Holliday junction resolvase RuvX [Chitinophagaceae bacterium]